MSVTVWNRAGIQYAHVLYCRRTIILNVVGVIPYIGLYI